jgi:dolichyl-phosphate beta-glucosyltransferase
MMATGQQDVHPSARRLAEGQPVIPAEPVTDPLPFDIPAGATLTRFFHPADHDLTIIVPAYNEESRLPATLDGLESYCNRWGVDYRVLVVDDGSRDGTARLTEGRGKRFATISQANAGKGAAVRNGMLRATGRVIAFTDADLPYDLDGVRAAYDAIHRHHCDVVFGARDLEESAVLAPRRLLRTLATLVFRSIVAQLVSRQVTDTQCGLKVFSRRAALEIFSRTSIDGFAFDAEVVFLTHRLRLPFQRIPVTLINEYGSTISLTRHALPMLLDVIGLRLRALRGDYDLERPVTAMTTAAPAADQTRTAA